MPKPKTAAIALNCPVCGTAFELWPYEVKNGQKCCSLECSRKHRAAATAECKLCGVTFKCPPRRQVDGKAFCSRKCHGQAQRVGSGFPVPEHYGKGRMKPEGNRNRPSAYTYRKHVLHRMTGCEICGDNKPLTIAVLEVHHIDGDHRNNAIENLQVACPTCHRIQHHLQKLERQATNAVQGNSTLR